MFPVSERRITEKGHAKRGTTPLKAVPFTLSILPPQVRGRALVHSVLLVCQLIAEGSRLTECSRAARDLIDNKCACGLLFSMACAHSLAA
jgi:hypothetical protein